MKAVIYARTAKRRTLPGHSIQDQVKSFRRYAKENGLDVTEEFADPGRSGATLDRPALNNMRELIGRDSIKALVIADLTRLSRSSADLSVLEKEFAKRGTRLHCVTRGMFSWTPRLLPAERNKKGTRLAAR